MIWSIQNMAQGLRSLIISLVFILVNLLFTSVLLTNMAFAAEAAIRDKISPETAFAQGLNCLNSSDLACAQLALAHIPSLSSNAQILAGGIAVLQADNDAAFRLLLPIATDTTLTDSASASLHASLSKAYEKLPDLPRAIEQKLLQETALIRLSVKDDIKKAQADLWRLLSTLNKDQLIELRGASTVENMQGWVDLSLARANVTDITNWQKAYPDHSAQSLAADLITGLSVPPTQIDSAAIPSATVSTPATATPSINNTFTGKVALLLPFDEDGFKIAANAIKDGFSASASIDRSPIEIKLYNSFVQKGDFANTYHLAVSEGANYVLGALENAALLNQPLTVPTMMLYGPFNQAVVAQNLTSFATSMEAEALKIAKTAQQYGMQNIVAISQKTSSSNVLTGLFDAAWQQQTGQAVKAIHIDSQFNLLDLKTQINMQFTSVDALIIAGDGDFARKIRPYLDIATPTFAFSIAYSGAVNDVLDANLNAIRLVDMPWLLNPEAFPAYQKAAANTPKNAAQRLFAMGADAYQILKIISQHPVLATQFNGLTGVIKIDENGQVTREPAMGIFTKTGVTHE